MTLQANISYDGNIITDEELKEMTNAFVQSCFFIFEGRKRFAVPNDIKEVHVQGPIKADLSKFEAYKAVLGKQIDEEQKAIREEKKK